MIKKILSIIFFTICLAFLGYLLLPNPVFPVPPQGILKSTEPADLETPLRQGYFTNSTREQVMIWYKNQLDRSMFHNVPFLTLRLNYPPEDAQTIIRDQTRSTFLEELAHPFRESIYVNGFVPPGGDGFNIGGVHYDQKIIVKYVPSSQSVRIIVFIGIIFFVCVLGFSWKKTLFDIGGKKIKV